MVIKKPREAIKVNTPIKSFVRTSNFLSRTLFLSAIIFAFLLIPAQNSFAALGEGTVFNRFTLMDGLSLADGIAMVDGGNGIEIGNVLVRPFVRIQEQYDSNIFLDELDPKDDWITTLDLGAEAELKMGDLLLKSGYVFDMNLFAGHEEENNFNHAFIAKADWLLTDYEVVVANKFIRTSDRAGLEDTGRISRQENLLAIDVLTEYNRLAFDIGYDFLIKDYLSDNFVSGTQSYDEAEDRFVHVFRGEMSYRFAPKTSILAETDYGIIDYDDDFNAESWYVEQLVGVRGEVLNGAVADMKVGVRYHEYPREGVDDYFGGVARGSITKRFGQKDIVTLSTERSIYDSTYGGSAFYELNHVGLGHVHQFNEKLSSHLYGSYQFNRYTQKTTQAGITAKRNDNIYRLRGGLRYDVKDWLAASTSYQFMKRASKFETFDFSDHLVTGTLTAQF